MSVILSGIQPSSSDLHLGNYIGSILNWKKIVKELKNNDMCYFMLADLHAMTSVHNADILRENIKNLIATYMACGLEPSDKVCFFQQSKISAHCELCWILSTITPIGQLERMTQFKDKKGKTSTDNINAGLLYYPILMAADIMLYKADLVPVGEDQLQHLEFIRDIIQKFSNLYENGKKAGDIINNSVNNTKDNVNTKIVNIINDNNIFVIPNAFVCNVNKRIMSLGDGSKKMSKSFGEEKDRIFLSDTDEQIEKKIRTSKTDSIIGVYYDKKNRPEISNLINIYASISGRTVEDISNEYREKNTKSFKDDLTKLLISELSPIRDKKKEFLKDGKKLEEILSQGNKIANKVAEETLLNVKKAVGLL